MTNSNSDGQPDGYSPLTKIEHGYAARNTSMPLEALDQDITPIGLHYTLCHWDVQFIDAANWKLEIHGDTSSKTLDFDGLRSLPRVDRIVTMECAGNGRKFMVPAVRGVPWRVDAVGTARWTGTDLGPLLEEVGIGESTCEFLFTGSDYGLERGARDNYVRSMTVAEAMTEGVMIVYAMNGQPIPPQHGGPVRLLVPRWHGMASVKWLKQIRTAQEPFMGVQMVENYRIRQSPDELGEMIKHMRPRSLMRPVGTNDYGGIERLVKLAPQPISGRTWSGYGDIVRVEFSADAGQTFVDADLAEPVSDFAWRAWSTTWTPETPGPYRLCSRATDSTGRVQPLDPVWNVEGVANNSVQFVDVIVEEP